MPPRRLILACLLALVGLRLGWDFAPPSLFFVPCGLGFWLGWHWQGPRWALWGALLYLAAPVPLPSLARLGVGLAASAYFWQWRKNWAWADVGLVGASFLILLLSLSPELLAADAGEFQVIAGIWGVAHSPGYPLYTMISGLFAEVLPFENVAWRVNVFSAVTGALTLGILSFSLRRETQNLLAGYLGGLTLLTALSFWMTATQASIRPLMAFFAVAMLEAALAYRLQPQKSAPLIRFGLAAGFGVTHHGSLIFLGLSLAVMMFVLNPRQWRGWALAILAALLGALPWLYLPLRAGEANAPEHLRTLDGFWSYVSARGFAQDMFAFVAPMYWEERAAIMLKVYAMQWQGGVLLLALGGGALAWRRDRWLAALLTLPFIVQTIVVGTYRAPQTVEYAIPAYIFIAFALAWLWTQLPRPAAIMVGAVALVALQMNFQSGWLTMQKLAARPEARDIAQNTLDQAPPNAQIYANWHRFTPLWYLQAVEGQRQDVQIEYVFPLGGLDPIQNWVGKIQSGVEAGLPVMTAPANPEYYRYLNLTFLDEQVAPSLAPSDSGEPLALLTQELDPFSARLGEVITLELDWALDRPFGYGEQSTFIHLGAADQPPFAQQDLMLYAPDAASGQIRYPYRLVLPYTAPLGEWPIWAGSYGAINTERVLVGKIRLEPARFPPVTQHPVYQKLDQLRLIGWDYDRFLYLHWEIRRAGAYTLELQDSAGGMLERQNIEVTESGYWTSRHSVLPHSLWVNGDSLRLPQMPHDEKFVLFGETAALVDWALSVKDGRLYTEVALLPMGASFEDVQLQFVLEGEDWRQVVGATPVGVSIPAFKWGYGREIRSRQDFAIHYDSPLRSVRLFLVDGFTGNIIPVQGEFGVLVWSG